MNNLPNSVNHQVQFLKQFIVVMMAMSLTNALSGYVSVWPKGQRNLEETLVFILLIINIIRFFYGNWMNLERVFGNTNNKYKGGYFFINFMLIITQCLAFVTLSFFNELYEHFFSIYKVVLAVDVIGFSIMSHGEDISTHVLHKKWLLNNLITVVVLSLVTKEVASEYEIFVSVLICYINTFIGFYFSWRFYLPFVEAVDFEEKS